MRLWHEYVRGLTPNEESIRGLQRTTALLTLFSALVVLGLAFNNCSAFSKLDPSSTGSDITTTATPPQVGSVRMAVNTPVPVKITGCNAPTWTQIPNQPDYFVGRIHTAATTADLNNCGTSEVYTLAWGKMDWSTHEIGFLGKLVDLNTVSPTLQNGKYTITTAYDPSVFYDGQDDWLAFECYGPGFPGSVGSCMVPFAVNTASTTPTATLDFARGYVAVLGIATDPASPYIFSASVPKLFQDDDKRVYLYWSAVQMPKTSAGIQDWVSITTRGVELVKTSAGQWAPKNYGIEMPSDNPASVEVFGVENLPQMHHAADSYQVTKFNGSYFLVGSSGDCMNPTEATAGCYRLTVRKSATPLGVDIFNHERMPEHLLPSNSVQYFHFLKRPSDGKIQLMGELIPSYATANQLPTGFYVFDLDSTSNFFDGTQPLAGDPIAANIQATYLAILQRRPSAAELANWGSQIYLGLSDAAFVHDVVYSTEAAGLYQINTMTPTAYVNYAWQTILGHAPDANSVNVLNSALAQGTTKPADVILQLVTSAEFQSKHPEIVPLYQ